jgi:SAM-dependent methyltransferase
VRQADADALLFGDESFDYVLSWNVIFHGTMGDVGCRLAEIWRVLKPGGLCQCTMLSKRDTQFGRGPQVAPDTFIRGSDPKAHPHYLLRLGHPCHALRRLRPGLVTVDAGGARVGLSHRRRRRWVPSAYGKGPRFRARQARCVSRVCSKNTPATEKVVRRPHIRQHACGRATYFCAGLLTTQRHPPRRTRFIVLLPHGGARLR